MKTIKFETLKQSALKQVESASDVASLLLITAINEHPPHTIKDWKKYCRNMILNWDVRQVKKLIKLFPGIVPVSCQQADVTCEYSENAEWVCVFQSQSFLERRRNLKYERQVSGY